MIPPGETIGIVGGGQLGRMIAIAARQMGYRVAVVEPKAGCAAAAVADEVLTRPYHDREALGRLAAISAVITFEFENVDPHAFARLDGLPPLRPAPGILGTCQDREAEKRWLAGNGFPVAPHAVAPDAEGLRAILSVTGPEPPLVVKTARYGYDGKGQVAVDSMEGLEEALAGLGGGPFVAEKRIDFEGEYSVLCARNPAGDTVTYPLCRNTHANHILESTICPAPDRPDEEVPRRIAANIARRLDYEGLLAVEFFRSREGEWMVNELAPRPHNSGHFSIDARGASQFENHVRAICGLPLAPPAPEGHAAGMVNLLGDLWEGGSPDWSRLLAVPGCHLHLYDKGEPRPGRKMGHVNLTANSQGELEERINRVRWALGSGFGT